MEKMLRAHQQHKQAIEDAMQARHGRSFAFPLHLELGCRAKGRFCLTGGCCRLMEQVLGKRKAKKTKKAGGQNTAVCRVRLVSILTGN
jgi:hypothetical protein